VPGRRRPATQRLSTHARRGVEGGIKLGSWGNRPENAEKPSNCLGFSVPQLWLLFPNYVGVKLGTNNAGKQRRIRDFPNFPTSIPTPAPARARDRDQLSLAGLGPDAGDAFRFTWHTTREGAAVWIEHRGRWRAGVVIGLGRKRAAVSIEAVGFKCLIVAKLYTELRRRR
jgi:hypothetical protein